MPENVTPTIQGRDFVIATVAAPTIVKEPEKPVEAEEGEAATTEGSEESAAEGEDKKDESSDKNAESEKSAAEKK